MGYRCFNVEASPPARPGITCTTNILLSSKLVQLLLSPVALNLVIRGCPFSHFFAGWRRKDNFIFIYIYTYKSGKTSEAIRGKVSMLYDKSHTHMHKIARSPCVIRLQFLQFRVSPPTVNSSQLLCFTGFAIAATDARANTYSWLCHTVITGLLVAFVVSTL